jgi:nucleoside-diphosphate-sugar epimerase
MKPGDGRQTRSCCYATDLIDGIVNIGNPIEFTIAELAEIVAQQVGVPLKVVEQDLPPDDPTGASRISPLRPSPERLGTAEPHASSELAAVAPAAENPREPATR